MKPILRSSKLLKPNRGLLYRLRLRKRFKWPIIEVYIHAGICRAKQSSTGRGYMLDSTLAIAVIMLKLEEHFGMPQLGTGNLSYIEQTMR